MSNPDPSSVPVWSANIASNIVVAGRLQSLVKPGTSYRTLDDKLSEIYSVKDFGGGTGDLAVTINAMISMGILDIYVPEGTYDCATPIVVSRNNVRLRGAGANTIINLTSGGAHGLELQTCSNVLVEDICFTAAVDRSVPVIYGNNTFRCFYQNVLCVEGEGADYGGMYFDGCNDTHITDCELHSSSKNGYGIMLTGTSLRCEDTYITATNVVGYNVGVFLEWSSGNYFTAMDVLSNGSAGVMFSPSSEHEVDGSRMVNILSDSNVGNGWSFIGGGSITETCLTGCWGATNGGSGANADGLHVGNPNVNGLAIIGFQAHHNTANGIALEQGSNITIMGATLYANALNGIDPGGTGSYFNAILVDSGVSFVSVIGCSMGRGGINANEVPKEFYGVEVVATDYIVVANNIGNQLRQAVIRIATPGDNVVSTGNIGNVYSG